MNFDVRHMHKKNPSPEALSLSDGTYPYTVGSRNSDVNITSATSSIQKTRAIGTTADATNNTLLFLVCYSYCKIKHCI